MPSPLTITSLAKGEQMEAFLLLRAQLDEHAILVSDEELTHAIGEIFRRPYLGDILLARVERESVGLAFLTYAWTPEIGGMAAWLEELYVKPSHRSCGLGTNLLQAAIALAQEKGCVSVDLQVEHSHARVVGLYERHGFREQPRRTFRFDLRQS